MRIALPAAVAGRPHPHETRVLSILHVAHEDAVLDQHGAIGGRALIVDGKRPAALRDGAIINNCHAFRSHPLPHEAGECGCSSCG